MKTSRKMIYVNDVSLMGVKDVIDQAIYDAEGKFDIRR